MLVDPNKLLGKQLTAVKVFFVTRILEKQFRLMILKENSKSVIMVSFHMNKYVITNIKYV